MHEVVNKAQAQKKKEKKKEKEKRKKKCILATLQSSAEKAYGTQHTKQDLMVWRETAIICSI